MRFLKIDITGIFSPKKKALIHYPSNMFVYHHHHNHRYHYHFVPISHFIIATNITSYEFLNHFKIFRAILRQMKLF